MLVTPLSEFRPFQGEDRRRHAPAGHRKLPGAIFHVAHDPRGLVGEDAGIWREIACGVSERTSEFAYRLRAFSDGVEVMPTSA